MKSLGLFCFYFILFNFCAAGQPVSFQTYMNPVIPGDHPDPTLTKIGSDFYTTGSSFNPTPKIYHSTDLVHWEVISQPVSASWSLYSDTPGGGVWGGHLVYYNISYWHFFGRAGKMYFVKANDPAGPWNQPTQLNTPSSVPGLGQDNSIFIDDNNRWYLLVKNGQSNNWIVELGGDGQPAGDIHNLTWLNPPPYPYSWAEGPVMWKWKGYYYYSFARNLAGGQYVMRSDTLTGDQTEWTIMGDFFSSVSNPNSILFREPNHCSPAIMLDDSTWWVIYHAYSKGNNYEWMGLGRQGLLSQVRYDEQGKPVADYPSNNPVTAPNLSSSGIPWAVPKSDMFDSEKLNPDWSFLGYTPVNTYSLTVRPGWLRLSPKNKPNTVIKNDAEHNYSLITKMEFNPATTNDEAGFWIFNGLQTIFAKLYCTVNDSGKNVIRFNFTNGSSFEAENNYGNTLWLKLFRENHVLTGYFSADGANWNQVGYGINVSAMDKNQPDYNAFTGSQQGLYVKGKSADFDLYIYRDAYSQILAQPAANQFGTLTTGGSSAPECLDSIHASDWALYAGVEFGSNDYPMVPDTLEIFAASASAGGIVEVWLDSIDTGKKIAECAIENTGAWTNFQTFRSAVDSVNGRHDVYLRFSGGTDKLFRIKWFRFLSKYDPPVSIDNQSSGKILKSYLIEQNYPNPFNPNTSIEFRTADFGFVAIKVYDILGNEIAKLVDEYKPAGEYEVAFNAADLPSGIYLYQLKAGEFMQTKKMMLMK